MSSKIGGVFCEQFFIDRFLFGRIFCGYAAKNRVLRQPAVARTPPIPCAGSAARTRATGFTASVAKTQIPFYSISIFGVLVKRVVFCCLITNPQDKTSRSGSFPTTPGPVPITPEPYPRPYTDLSFAE
jgi:hypothetical protein